MKIRFEQKSKNLVNTLVSVIVPMRNEKQHIQACLASLIRQDYSKENTEILVIDGMSTDGSRAIVESIAAEDSSFKLFDNPGKTPPCALNIGISKVQGSIIIRVDAHSSVAADFVSRSVEYLQKTGAECVGGRVEAKGKGYWGKAISFVLSSPFGVGGSKFRYSEKEGYVDTVAFGAYRREVFDKIGFFDERLGRNQDIEFNSRLRKKGGKIFFTPLIRSYYYCPNRLGKFAVQAFKNGLWNIKTTRMMPGSLSPRHFVPLFFVMGIVICFGLSFIGTIGKIGLAAITASYLVLALAFSLGIALKHGLIYLPILPLMFLKLHLSYGVGSLWGIIRLPFDRG